MRIVFWNLFKKNNIDKVVKMLIHNEIDIGIFSEFSNTFHDKKTFCDLGYTVIDGYGGCDKIIFVIKKSINAQICREQFRYSICRVTEDDKQLFIAGVHFQDNCHSDSEDRKEEISFLLKDINEMEIQYDSHNTIVIGDFNCSPFDPEVIQKNKLNCVLYKELIKKQEIVTHNHRKYRRFYNPMLSVFSESNKIYGSFYRSSGIDTLYWFFYDQVIMRKDLIDSVDDIRILMSIENTKLLTKEGLPNKKISDHLPLYMEVCL